MGKNNNALAISTGLSPTGAQAIANGQNNNVVAIDGVAITGPKTYNNNVVSVLGVTTVGLLPTDTSNHNNVTTIGGLTNVGGNSHDNTIVNTGGAVIANGAVSQTSVSACGTSLTGQAAHITTSPALCGG